MITLHVHPSVSAVSERNKQVDLGALGSYKLPLASSSINETDTVVRIPDGQIVAIRYGDWKTVFLENRGQAFEVWREPFTELRVPLLFNLRRDPFEKSQHNATVYNDWFLDHAFVAIPLQQIAGRFLKTMVDYPPSQTPGSFNLEKIQKQIEAGAAAR